MRLFEWLDLHSHRFARWLERVTREWVASLLLKGEGEGEGSPKETSAGGSKPLTSFLSPSRRGEATKTTPNGIASAAEQEKLTFTLPNSTLLEATFRSI